MKIGNTTQEFLFARILPLCVLVVPILILIGYVFPLSFAFDAACALQIAVGILLFPVSFVLTVMALVQKLIIFYQVRHKQNLPVHGEV